MEEKLQRIRQKLRQLREADKSCKVFGAKKHRYSLNPTTYIQRIQQLEQRYGIVLPPEYVAFVTSITNGGAGPHYGLEPLGNALYGDLDSLNKDELLNPAQPFPHTQVWNLQFEPTVSYEENSEEYMRQLGKYEENYFDKKWIDGVINIGNMGCGIRLCLVVNGEEYGHIWADDRSSDGGIYPVVDFGITERIGFLDWYELWLDTSLHEIAENDTKYYNKT